MGPGARMTSAFELWKFDSLAEPAPARAARTAPKEADPAAALDQLREAARREGYQAGLAVGHAEGKGLAEQEAMRLRALLSAFGDAVNRMQEEVGTALLGLAFDVARQVLRAEIAQQPESILPAIREALDLGANGQQGQLLLNHADADFVKEHLHELLTAGQWRVLEDSSVEPGGCQIVTTSGSIDATLATRWQRVAAALGNSDAW